jgi:hypothetical protein
MGYYMQVVDTKFRIKRENFGKALLAIKSLAGKETYGTHFSWVNTPEFLKAETLEEGIKAWRWEAEVEGPSGDVTDISFRGEKLGDDELFFQVIAPFVEKGSFVEMSGDDNGRWRWFFDGYTVLDQTAKVTYDE